MRDLSHPEHVWQVGGGEFAALRSLAGTQTNLPVQLSSFVGRERELAELGELVHTQRLVSLVGVGGVNKAEDVVEVTMVGGTVVGMVAAPLLRVTAWATSSAAA